MDRISAILAKVEPERRPAIYWVLSDSWVLTRRSIKHITRNLDQLLSLILMPVMFLILFRYVFGGAIDTGDTSYPNFLLAGILVETLAFGSSNTTVNIVLDLKRGIVDRFRSLPMNSSALLTGHVIADLIRNTISGLIMLIAGFAVGFRPTAGPLEWLAVFGLLLLFTFAMSWFCAILGLIVKSLEAAQWVSYIVIMPLTFASSAFVPTDNMPTALRVFAENQPFTIVIQAMRAWLVGTPIGNAGWLSVVWCVAITLAAMPTAAWLFRRQTQVPSV
jgi:ABC-2 type transport system permease protein